MSNAATLQEFLIRLGFKVDETSQRRMVDVVKQVKSKLLALGATAATVGTAVGVAVVKVASDLDNLYFASKRIGASAGNIRAFEYALKQMGGSREGARALLESLARFERNSPGAEGWLNSLGVQTRDANGNLLDMVEQAKSLAEVLKGMDSATANAVAERVGMDDKTLQALRSGDLKAYMADYLATLDKLGIKQDEAAENSAKLAHQLDALKTIFGLLLEKFAAGVIGADHGKIWEPEIAAVKRFVEWLDLLNHRLTDLLNKLTGGKFGEVVGRTTAKIMASLGSKEALAALQANGDLPGAASAAPASGAPKAGPGDKRSAAMAFFRKMGWSQAQAAGIVANLMSESGLEPGAVGDNGQAFGIGQWHPDRQANFRRWAGKDIRQSTLQEQLAFVQYELTQGAEQRAGALLLASRNAQDAGSVVSRFYERPLAADAEAAKRGALAMQIANSTTIHVNGSSDPLATAQAVASLQVQTSQDMTRNLRGAMQ